MEAAPLSAPSTRIVINGDGHVFKGSPVEIVCAMRTLAWPAASLPLPGYIDWAVANARKFLAVEMQVAQGNEEACSGPSVSRQPRAAGVVRADEVTLGEHHCGETPAASTSRLGSSDGGLARRRIREPARRWPSRAAA